jgi:hypothetical protein
MAESTDVATLLRSKMTTFMAPRAAAYANVERRMAQEVASRGIASRASTSTELHQVALPVGRVKEYLQEDDLFPEDKAKNIARDIKYAAENTPGVIQSYSGKIDCGVARGQNVWKGFTLFYVVVSGTR